MMKRYLILLAAMLLTANVLQAQCSLSITTPDTTVCQGDSVSLYTQAIPAGTTLEATMLAGNNHRGNMFDIAATNPVIITSFDAHPMGNTTIAVYYRPTPYAGFETSSAGWILIGSAPVIAQPYGTPTPVPVPINITIPAGQTYSFYVTSTNTTISFNYTTGSTEGTVFTGDANISFLQGVGMEYPFTAGTGAVFRPRIWNGVIHYSVLQGVTYDYTWSNAATTADITIAGTTTTQYSVALDMPGCPTVHDTVTVTVNPLPAVNAGIDVNVCDGNPVMLTATGADSLAWSNSITDSEPFIPLTSDEYVVTGIDTNGCVNTDTVTVTVNPIPVVSGGGDITVCEDTQIALSGSGADTYAWNNDVENGEAFIIAATDTFTVIGITAAGCQDTAEVVVTVNQVNSDVSLVNDITLLADASSATYQWYDCSTSLPIPGATGQSFTATANGNYSVSVGEGDCSEMSDCYAITSVGISEATLPTFELYPNPANGSVTVSTPQRARRIDVTDINGKTVLAIQPKAAQAELELGTLNNGVYFVRVTLDNSILTQKLVVKH